MGQGLGLLSVPPQVLSNTTTFTSPNDIVLVNAFQVTILPIPLMNKKLPHPQPNNQATKIKTNRKTRTFHPSIRMLYYILPGGHQPLRRGNSGGR